MITAPRCATADTAVRLWVHECSRVFYDRLINREDQIWFEDLVIELLPRYLKVFAVTISIVAITTEERENYSLCVASCKLHYTCNRMRAVIHKKTTSN